MMEIYFNSVLLRAIDGALCDFLTKAGAKITLERGGESFSFMIDTNNFDIDFGEDDECPYIKVVLVKNSERLCYIFNSSDVGKIEIK